jgi:hypothetical protein
VALTDRDVNVPDVRDQTPALAANPLVLRHCVAHRVLAPLSKTITRHWRWWHDESLTMEGGLSPLKKSASEFGFYKINPRPLTTRLLALVAK